MTGQELLQLFRQEMNDLVAPYLWSDAEILAYIDDAQMMFCRKTDGVADASTADIVNIEVNAGQDWYITSPLVLKWRTAFRRDNGRPVDIVNIEDTVTQGMRFDGRSGPVSAMVIGLERTKVRVWPVPAEDVVIETTVFRLPLQPVNNATKSQQLEVDVQHHTHLLRWVKSRAYGKQDSEAFDKTKAREFEQSFLQYCEDSKIEDRRLRHKTRVVAYGGL